MPSPKEDFERLAPDLLQGNLWRTHLTHRKTNSETLEQILKTFLNQTLEITKAFPEIKGNLLATLPLTQLVGKALKKLQDHLVKLKKVDWYDRLTTYQSALEKQVRQLEQTLQELGELGNRVATAKVRDVKLTDVLLCHEDHSVRPLIEMPTYQSFAQNAKDEHYTLLLEFLKKAQEVGTLFTDLVLVNKAFALPEDSVLSILKDETYISQHLSNTAIILILSFSEISILDIANHQQNSSLHPALLLKKLSNDDWTLLIRNNIGIQMAALAKAISEDNLIVREVFPKEVAVAFATSVYPFIGQALLSSSSWMETLSDDEFIRAVSSLYDTEVKAVLSKDTSKILFCNRLTKILNDKIKREQLLKTIHFGSSKAFIRLWLIDATIFEGLSNETLRACLLHDYVQGFSHLIAHQPLFLKRLETFDGNALVDLMEQHYKQHPGSTFEYLSQPTLLAILDTDELLIRALILLISDANYINKLRKDNPNLDKRLTSSFLVRLIQKEPCLLPVLTNDEELLSRFGITDIHALIKYCDCDLSVINYFLAKNEILTQFTEQQLVEIQRSSNYSAYFTKYLKKQNDIIAAELERRQASQNEDKPANKSPLQGPTTNSNTIPPHQPTRIVTKTDLFKNEIKDKQSVHISKDSTISGIKIAEGILLITLLLLGAGLLTAFLLSASFIVLISLNIAMLVDTAFSIGLYAVNVINPQQSISSTPSSKNSKFQTNSSTQIELPKHYPHPATRTPHLGANSHNASSSVLAQSYVAPTKVIS